MIPRAKSCPRKKQQKTQKKIQSRQPTPSPLCHLLRRTPRPGRLCGEVRRAQAPDTCAGVILRVSVCRGPATMTNEPTVCFVGALIDLKARSRYQMYDAQPLHPNRREQERERERDAGDKPQHAGPFAENVGGTFLENSTPPQLV